jgi:hypothetical protein
MPNPVPFPTPGEIDFPVSYSWARFYDPTLPAVDCRPERERRIDDFLDRAMVEIALEMKGEPAPPTAIDSPELNRLASRTDYLQVELGEARRRIRDLERLVGGKARTGISKGGVEV